MACNLCGLQNVHNADCPAMRAQEPLDVDYNRVYRERFPSRDQRIEQAYKDGLWAGSVERDKVYAERNKLVCALSKLWPSHLAQHPATDAAWDPKWRTIVCIYSPMGQLSWHIMDSELHMFEHLPLRANEWDGHTTEEKYRRLAMLRPSTATHQTISLDIG